MKPLLFLAVAAMLCIGSMAAASHGDAAVDTKVAAILILGAVTNVVVAWTITYRGRS